MNIIEAVKSCFSRYAVFSGRSLRSEYWYFSLFNLIVSFMLGTFDVVMGYSIDIDESILANIYSLAVLIPSLAVSIRRLHDVNRSGWWVLIPITIIGIIPYIYWLCKKGDHGENRFGEDPFASFKNVETTR